MINRLINIGDKLLLTVPVWKGEFHFPDAFSAHMIPLILKIRPPAVALCDSPKPLCQFLHTIIEIEIPDLLRVHIAVGEPDPDLFQIILGSINKSVAFCLGEMDRKRIPHLRDLPVGPLDLVNRDHIPALRPYL